MMLTKNLRRFFSIAVLIFLVFYAFLFYLAGCSGQKRTGPRVGGGITPTPESKRNAFLEHIKNHKRFRCLDEATQELGYRIRLPKEKLEKIRGIFISEDRGEVLVVFDDYPPFNVYLSVIKKSKQPDHRRKVERSKMKTTKSETLLITQPQLVNVACHLGLAEEPTYQGGEKKFPVSGFVRWWDSGLEYYLFGRADGRNKPTSVQELLKIAESMY